MAELIVTAINVFVLCFALGYILSPMVAKMLSKRRTQIADDLEDAKVSREDAAAAAKLYEEKLANFDAEREAILQKAREKAKVKEDEIIGEAQAEADRIMSRADREADLLRAKIKDDIKKDMVNYAAAAAAKLIAENMDAKKQDELIEQTLKDMGEATWQN